MSTVRQQSKPTAASWKKGAVHDGVLCPSGVRISLRIPDLSQMIATGQIPQHMLEAALGASDTGATTPTVELVKEQVQFTNSLVSMTVVEPKITEDDASDIPTEDKEFIVAIATRQRDVDAEGEHIAGLSTSEKWRRFRRVGEFDTDVAGL